MNNCLLLICLFALSSTGKSETVLLKLADRVQVQTERFVLAQVATCNGPEVSCRVLRSIDLGKSPRPAEKKVLTSTEISRILAEEGFELDAASKEITIVGSSISIESVAFPVDSELIRQSIEEQLEPVMTKGALKKWTASLTINAKTINMASPEWGAKLIGIDKFTKEMEVSRSPFVRRVQIRVFGLNGREFADDVWGTLRLTPIFKALTIANGLEKGAVLSESDVSENWVSFAQFMEGVPSQKSSVIGKRAKMTLRPGSLLRWGVVEDVPLVGRGDEVQIKLISGALEMEAKGKAMNSGSLGQTVEVEVLGSKKRIKSLVLSAGLVEATL